MAERPRVEMLAYMGLFLLLFGLSLFFRLLPLNIASTGLPAPDLMLCAAMAWILRRPSHLPAPLIGGAFFLEDLFTLRPPGLWALAVLAGTEFLRRRHGVAREMTLMLEWAMVSAVMVVMWLAYRSVLAIVMVPQNSLDLSLLGLVFTVACYPVVVILLHYGLRIRKPAPGELDELGRKL
ncbi:MAG: rod shape-determining protein MreD [Pararhodobacter sp.]|nr:rod shape-determining protein MreD [Pararhodobacter sp.]